MCPPQCPNCRGRQFPPTLVMDVVLTTERRCFSAFPISKSSSSRSCRRHNAWFRPAQSQYIQTCTHKYRHTQTLKHIHTKTQAHTDAQIIHIGSRDSQTQSHSNICTQARTSTHSCLLPGPAQHHHWPPAPRKSFHPLPPNSCLWNNLTEGEGGVL